MRTSKKTKAASTWQSCNKKTKTGCQRLQWGPMEAPGNRFGRHCSHYYLETATGAEGNSNALHECFLEGLDLSMVVVADNTLGIATFGRGSGLEPGSRHMVRTVIVVVELPALPNTGGLARPCLHCGGRRL